jgi:hypothetical protein
MNKENVPYYIYTMEYYSPLNGRTFCQALVAHAYNPSYSGRDKVGHGLKPNQANSL